MTDITMINELWAFGGMLAGFTASFVVGAMIAVRRL